MSEARHESSSAMFENDEDIWWVTGGQNAVQTSDTADVYSATANNFFIGPALPKPMTRHNLVNVNNTHMVILGGTDDEESFDLYIYSRFVKNLLINFVDILIIFVTEISQLGYPFPECQLEDVGVKQAWSPILMEQKALWSLVVIMLDHRWNFLTWTP